jgi:hypothetical protein
MLFEMLRAVAVAAGTIEVILQGVACDDAHYTAHAAAPSGCHEFLPLYFDYIHSRHFMHHGHSLSSFSGGHR